MASRVYIRIRDKGKLSEKDYNKESGALLVHYKGTRAKAKRLGIPLFYANGTKVNNLTK